MTHGTARWFVRSIRSQEGDPKMIRALLKTSRSFFMATVPVLVAASFITVDAAVADDLVGTSGSDRRRDFQRGE